MSVVQTAGKTGSGHLRQTQGSTGSRARDSRADNPGGNAQNDDSAATVHAALQRTPTLKLPSVQRETLWITVLEEVCTRGYIRAQALGSRWEGDIGGEDARHTELVAAMWWLTEHEREARQMSPGALMRRLRGVAVRGKRGSVRQAQADAVHGVTDIPEGQVVAFISDTDLVA